MMNDDQHVRVCQCQRGWQGSHCERPLSDIKCSPYSLAQDQHMRICPHGYLEPHYFVLNTICNHSKSGSVHEICYPSSHQPPHRCWCLYNDSNCDKRNAVIVMHRQKPNQLSFRFRLLRISKDHPRLHQQMLTSPLTNFPITALIHLYGSHDIKEPLSEIALLFTFEARIQSIDIILHLLYINCSKSSRNFTVDLDV